MKNVSMFVVSALTSIVVGCSAKPKASDSSLNTLRSGDHRVCYKNMAPTIPAPTGPRWSVFFSDKSGSGRYNVTADRDGQELYGKSSRNLELTFHGTMQDGRLLFQSDGGTAWVIFSSKGRGEFHSEFYGKDVLDMTCNNSGLIPESGVRK